MKWNKIRAVLLAAALAWTQVNAQAQQNEVIPLWKNGAPGFESKAK